MKKADLLNLTYAKIKSMISIDAFRELALSFPGTTEAPHFEKTSFRVANKIFATLDVANQRVCIKLSEIDQSVFCSIDKSIIYPVDNKWGKQGWTLIELARIKKNLLKDALSKAFDTVNTSKKAKSKE
jgi:hypothetical protein